MTRSGALRPGEFRRKDQGIRITTRHGRHAPAAIKDSELQRLVSWAVDACSPREQASNLFVSIAKAQPFEDGNKRTAIFVANGLLIRERPYELLTIPLNEDEGTQKESSFNELLARSYIYGEDREVKNLMRDRGFSLLPHRS